MSNRFALVMKRVVAVYEEKRERGRGKEMRWDAVASLGCDVMG